MTVESATYISDLNSTYPAGTDAKSEGDNHIRLIKSTIKATFPNVNGAVSATDEELNYCDITTLGTQQASKAVTADANNTVTVPSGGEINFASGAQLQIAGVAVTSSAAELNILDGVTLTAAKINGLLTFGIQFNLDVGSDADFTIDQYASFGYTVDTAVYETGSGTVTANVKINGTSITGLSALSITSTEGGPTTASGGKTLVAGDTLSVTFSSSSAAERISLKLNCTRT